MSEPSASSNPWIWSGEHQRYYRYEFYSDGTYQLHANGQPKVIWQQTSTPSSLVPNTSSVSQEQPQIVYSPPPQDSAYSNQTYATQARDYGYLASAPYGNTPKANFRDRRADSQSAIAEMPPRAPAEIRPQIEFLGTPELGWYEPFDSRYCVRTSSNEFQFFKPGRVFAMLWSETAGQNLNKRTATDNSHFTILPNSPIVKGSYGEDIFCQIRRFVIVRVNRKAHFVEACAITTYQKRGVLKPGCNASEHTIVYLKGTNPGTCYLEGEYEKGMKKSPIAIEPTDATETMLPSSRLRLGKTYSIECNVKVRDIGMVSKEDRTKLIGYWQKERDSGFEADSYDDDFDEDTPAPPPTGPWPPPYRGSQGHSGYYAQQSYHGYQ